MAAWRPGAALKKSMDCPGSRLISAHPPIQLLKEWQKTHNNAALNDIMILRSNDNLSVFELSKRALTAGTCHAVIAWTDSLNQDEFSKLEEASSKGNSHGIILKSRLNSLQSL